MSAKPIEFDETKPLAHYKAAAALKKKTDIALNFGRVVPIFSFLAGVVCVATNPFSIAMHALFGLSFAILSIVSCCIKNVRLCLISIPLGVISAALLAVSGSVFSPYGAALSAITVLLEIRAFLAIYDLDMLRGLPGFPFFEAGMEDITFAAIEHHGGDEFLKGFEEEEKTERIRYLPTEPPSDEMPELSVSEASEDGSDAVLLLKPIEDKSGETSYEKMVSIGDQTPSGLSDIDLFG